VGHRVGRGLGYLLAQQLVDAGEQVLDVPPTLASRVRVLGSGRSGKNDPNDALSVAVRLCARMAFGGSSWPTHTEIMRLLAKRNHDLGRMRARLACRLHNALADLSPGGIAKELYVSDAHRLLEGFEPVSPIEHMRHELALELADDVGRLDEQIKDSHRRIRTGVRASKTMLTELYGVGPILACALIGYTGDVHRFASRDHFAAYAGVAPIEHSSGGRVAHRLSRRGHRKLKSSTWSPSPRSGTPAPMGGSTSIARSRKERPSERLCAPSSAISPMPSIASCSLTPKGAREDTRKRLVACVVGSAS
jgi:transposase